MTRKIIIINILFVLLATIALAVFLYIERSNRPPEYIWFSGYPEMVDKLSSENVLEIDIDLLNDCYFNNTERRELLYDVLYGGYIPTDDYERIQKIKECIFDAQNSHNKDLGHVLQFNTGEVIYCINIGWDNEKIYGLTWETSELRTLIDNYKFEASKRAEEGRIISWIKQITNPDDFQYFKMSYPNFTGKALVGLSPEEESKREEEIKSAYIKYVEKRRKEHAEQMETNETYRRIWTELVEQNEITPQIGGGY
ncbi:MAG: hypothetical protein ACIAQZ_01415 [Sedimentisphaeraceae bacterium JB056]